MIEYEGNRYFGAPARRRPTAKPPLPARSGWLWLVSNAAWVFLGVVAFAALTAVLSFGTGALGSGALGMLRYFGPSLSVRIGPALAFMSPALALIVLASVAALVTAIRREQARRVMLYVHQAVRLNLPLPELIAAAEAGERGLVRARLAKLRRLLSGGAALGYAIERAAPGVPRRHLAAVAAGEHLGRLPEALDRVVADGLLPGSGDADTSTPSATDVAATQQLRWYPILMLVFLGTALNLLMFFVMPKFESILDDFKQPMPAVTRGLVDFWRDCGGPFFTLIPPVLLAIYCGRTLARTVAPRWAATKSGLHLIDRLGWWLPIARPLVRGRALADALYVAADALSAGATLPRALAEAATVPDNAVGRQWFAKWATLVEQGAAPADAARTIGMPQHVSGMIASGISTAQLEGVTRFLARYYDVRANRLVAALEGAAVPALSMIFGAAVATVALAVFLPLIGMMNNLMDRGFR